MAESFADASIVIHKEQKRLVRRGIRMIGAYGKRLCVTALCIVTALFVAAGCGKQESDAEEVMASQNYETYALSFYQYGSYIEEDTAEIDAEQFRIYHDSELIGTYPYRKLSDFLISLYEEDAQAYVICRYELAENEMHMTLDLLGAIPMDMAGDWDVIYANQNSTAKLSLLAEGLGREYDQFDAAGKAVGEETSFFYCFRGKEGGFRLFLLTTDQYYIYEAEVDKEQRLLRLTIAEEGTYIQNEDGKDETVQ